MMSPFISMILSYLYTQMGIRHWKVCSICVRVHVLVTKSIRKGHVSTKDIGTGGVWGGGTTLTF